MRSNHKQPTDRVRHDVRDGVVVDASLYVHAAATCVLQLLSLLVAVTSETPRHRTVALLP